MSWSCPALSGAITGLVTLQPSTRGFRVPPPPPRLLTGTASNGFGGFGPLRKVHLDAPHRLLGPCPRQLAQSGGCAQLLARGGQPPNLLGQRAPVGRFGEALIQVGLDRRGGPYQPVAGRLGELSSGPDLVA